MSEDSNKQKASFIALGTMLGLAAFAAFGAEAVERKNKNEARLKRIEEDERKREHTEFLARAKRDREALEAAVRARDERIAELRVKPVTDHAVESLIRRVESIGSTIDSVNDSISSLSANVRTTNERIDLTNSRVEEVAHAAHTTHREPYPFKNDAGN